MNKELEVRINDNLHRVAGFVAQKGLYPVFVSLHGSQNYGVDIYTAEYQSDFDYKCIVLPNLWNLVENSKPVSMVYDFEGGHVDVKDIRVFIDTVLKMNPSYLEGFLTPYSLVVNDEGKWLGEIGPCIPSLLNERGLLFTKACYGMFMEKKKAMCHPYPTLIHKIEKWGYDGKQVHHMYRLLQMLKAFEAEGKLELRPPAEEIPFLIDLKLNRFTLEEAQKMIEQWENELNELRNRLEKRYENVKTSVSDEIMMFSRYSVYHYCCTERGRIMK